MKYDINYFYHLLKIYSSTAEQINKIRWSFVSNIEPKVVLDYGCGCGFFKAFAPDNIEVDTYDIMPIPQTGIIHKHYDLITFWDVLEHEDWGNLERNYDLEMEKVFDITHYVAVTVPILPANKDFINWKHRKPGEHLTRFENKEEVIKFFRIRNFKLIKCGMPECPPREDIWSFLFKK